MLSRSFRRQADRSSPQSRLRAHLPREQYISLWYLPQVCLSPLRLYAGESPLPPIPPTDALLPCYPGRPGLECEGSRTPLQTYGPTCTDLVTQRDRGRCGRLARDWRRTGLRVTEPGSGFAPCVSSFLPVVLRRWDRHATRGTVSEAAHRQTCMPPLASARPNADVDRLRVALYTRCKRARHETTHPEQV